MKNYLNEKIPDFGEEIVAKTISEKLEEKYQNGELSVTSRIVIDRIPTNLVGEEVATQLEENYQTGQIEGIETTYLVGSRVEHSVPVQEYEYNGKKYVRVKAEFGTNENNLKFSNGQEIISGQPYWLHVEPLVKIFRSNQVFMTETTKKQEESATRNEEIQILKKSPDNRTGMKTDMTEFLKNYVDSNKSSDQRKEWIPSSEYRESQNPHMAFSDIGKTSKSK